MPDAEQLLAKIDDELQVVSAALKRQVELHEYGLLRAMDDERSLLPPQVARLQELRESLWPASAD